MSAAEALRDIAVPAHGLVARQHVDDLLGSEASPGHERAVGGEEGRLSVVPVEGGEAAAAEGAGLPLVPVGEDRPQEARLGPTRSRRARRAAPR
jgi:hypothetical protein